MIDDYDYAEYRRTHPQRPASEPPISDSEEQVGYDAFLALTRGFIDGFRARLEDERAQAAKAFGEEVDRRAAAERECERWAKENRELRALLTKHGIKP